MSFKSVDSHKNEQNLQASLYRYSLELGLRTAWQSPLTKLQPISLEDMPTRYLSRFFDCLAHPNLRATFAKGKKLPFKSHLRISKFSTVPFTIVQIRVSNRKLSSLLCSKKTKQIFLVCLAIFNSVLYFFNWWLNSWIGIKFWTTNRYVMGSTF